MFFKAPNLWKEVAELALHSVTLCKIKPAITSSKCKNGSVKRCMQRLLTATMLCHQFIMAAILPALQGLPTNQVSNKEVGNEIMLFWAKKFLPLNFNKLKWFGSYSLVSQAILQVDLTMRYTTGCSKNVKKENNSFVPIIFGGWSPEVHLLAKPALHAATAKTMRIFGQNVTKCLLKLQAVQAQRPSHHWALTSAGDSKWGLEQKHTGAQILRQQCNCMCLGPNRPSSVCQRCANTDSAGQYLSCPVQTIYASMIWWAQSFSDPSQHTDAFKLNRHIYRDIQAWSN